MEIEYNPSCSICRDLAGKDRAGVLDREICLPHLRLGHRKLKSRGRELEAEKEAWKETAAQHLRNENYYRGLVQETGKHFGADAYISDDGSIQQDILCAKVPDLVTRMNERVWELESERTLFQEYVAKNPKVMEDAEREMELTERICELEAERDEYKRQADGYYQEAATAYETRNKAIELLSEQYTDLNRDGKTILDFQNTWIRQTRDENDKLRAERDRLKEECVRWEAMYEGMMAERDGLEAELAKCQQVATPIGFGEILQSALDERDNLRDRHAALVEVAGRTVLNNPHTTGELKAALAEVK